MRAGTGVTLFCVAACGGAQDTPYYGTPLAPDGAASSGALTSGGGQTSSGTGGTPFDAAGMHAAGHEFFRAANGVWLTAAVPAAFIAPAAAPAAEGVR